MYLVIILRPMMCFAYLTPFIQYMHVSYDDKVLVQVILWSVILSIAQIYIFALVSNNERKPSLELNILHPIKFHDSQLWEYFTIHIREPIL